MSGALRFALAGGALLDSACTLLRDAGVAPIEAAAFDRLLMVTAGPHTFIKVRPTDVDVYVEMGACDVGVVGKDMLWESQRVCYELVDLRFGACRLSVAALKDSPIARGEWPAGVLRIATKYPVAAARFFDSIGVAVELIKLHGSIELAPATGLADAVVDIVDTGRTLRANGLVEVVTADTSTARLIVNHASLKTRSQAINEVAVALRAAADFTAAPATAAQAPGGA